MISNTNIKGIHYENKFDRYRVAIGGRDNRRIKRCKTLDEAINLKKQMEQDDEYNKLFENV